MSSDDVGSVLVSAAPIRIGAPVDREAETVVRDEPWSVEARRLAMEWQEVGHGVPMLWELSGDSDGRGYEVGGLVASAGEQLAMAAACVVEAQLWANHRHSGVVADDGYWVGAEMCQRCICEAAIYNLLAIGHRLANVMVRALTRWSSRRSVAQTKFPQMSHAPNDYSHGNWLSLEKDSVKKMRQVSRASLGTELPVEALRTLVQGDSWKGISELRAQDFHRRRPQTGGIAGASMGSPWTPTAAGQSGTLGGPEYTDGEGLADRYLESAKSSLVAICEAMEGMSTHVENLVRYEKPSFGN